MIELKVAEVCDSHSTSLASHGGLGSDSARESYFWDSSMQICLTAVIISYAVVCAVHAHGTLSLRHSCEVCSRD